MKVLRLRKKGMLKPSWTFKTRGVIWRIIPSETGHLLTEIRFPDSKQVEFFCLDRGSGEVLWSERGFGDQWWIGMEGVHGDVLYLHGFATPDLPEHKQITAVDVATGKQLWFNSELKFYLAVSGSVYATKEMPEGSVVLELDYRTGAILRSWGTDYQVLREARIRSVSSAATTIEFPVPFDAVPDPDGRLTGLLPEGERIGPVEVAHGSTMTVLNYHKKSDTGIPEETRVDNVLKVFDRSSGKMVYQELLNAGATTVIPDSFFVQGDTLYYIKERKTLTAVSLRAGE